MKRSKFTKKQIAYVAMSRLVVAATNDTWCSVSIEARAACRASTRAGALS